MPKVEQYPVPKAPKIVQEAPPTTEQAPPTTKQAPPTTEPTPPTTTTTEPTTSEQPKKARAVKSEKKGKGGGGGETSSTAAPVDVSRLNMRVGRIQKAWKHPDADGLYVEEGEDGFVRARVY